MHACVCLSLCLSDCLTVCLGPGPSVLKSYDRCQWESHCIMSRPKQTCAGLPGWPEYTTPHDWRTGSILCILASARCSRNSGLFPTRCGRAEEWWVHTLLSSEFSSFSLCPAFSSLLCLINFQSCEMMIPIIIFQLLNYVGGGASYSIFHNPVYGIYFCRTVFKCLV